jgi:anti-sigma-K factor RskA
VNVEAYISSGILEAYVLGELSDQERLEVEKNLKLYPELRKELALIEETQEQLLMKTAIAPRPSVKKSLFEKIDSSKQATKVVQLPTRQPRALGGESGVGFWKFAVAASVTVALITSYLAYDYRDKWKKTESNLAELTAQNQQMANDYNTVNQRLDAIENDLRVTNNPDFNRILMRGTPNAPGALASVYWNEKTKEVYLSVQDLKKLSQENQYQLWAIIDGKPVDAGVFDSNFTGLLKMKEIGSGAATFAVTIEPRGGRPTPSLETMQVAGNVVKS